MDRPIKTARTIIKRVTRRQDLLNRLAEQWNALPSELPSSSHEVANRQSTNRHRSPAPHSRVAVDTADKHGQITGAKDDLQTIMDELEADLQEIAQKTNEKIPLISASKRATASTDGSQPAQTGRERVIVEGSHEHRAVPISSNRPTTSRSRVERREHEDEPMPMVDETPTAVPSFRRANQVRLERAAQGPPARLRQSMLGGNDTSRPVASIESNDELPHLSEAQPRFSTRLTSGHEAQDFEPSPRASNRGTTHDPTALPRRQPPLSHIVSQPSQPSPRRSSGPAMNSPSQGTSQNPSSWSQRGFKLAASTLSFSVPLPFLREGTLLRVNAEGVAQIVVPDDQDAMDHEDECSNGERSTGQHVDQEHDLSMTDIGDEYVENGFRSSRSRIMASHHATPSTSQHLINSPRLPTSQGSARRVTLDFAPNDLSDRYDSPESRSFEQDTKRPFKQPPSSSVRTLSTPFDATSKMTPGSSASPKIRSRPAAGRAFKDLAYGRPPRPRAATTHRASVGGTSLAPRGSISTPIQHFNDRKVQSERAARRTTVEDSSSRIAQRRPEQIFALSEDDR